MSSGGPLSRFMSGGPVQSLLNNLMGNGTAEGPIAGQDVQNQMTQGDIDRTQGTIWDQPINGELGQFADLAPNQGGAMAQIATPDQGPSEYSMDPNAVNMGPPMSHAERQDYRDSLANNGSGQSANYGISPMQANGQNLIVGENGFDPNGRAIYNWGLPGN